jgi:metallo-beta-lactamase family protein
MKIQFLGAAQEVTGSKHLITTEDGKRILLDCGMFQGKGEETFEANRNLGCNAIKLDYIILSHAHIDHSGLVPLACKIGFAGTVVCTNATRDLCSIMLADSGYIQEQDVRWFNKRRARKGLPPVDPLFTRIDAVNSMQYFMGVPYGKTIYLEDNIKVTFINSGHMLGSAVVNLEITENGTTTRVAYTGDIGRPKTPILKSPKPFPQADILITESTYGDRLHDHDEKANAALLDVINKTCVEKGGKVIIPSFSIGRTQQVVLALNNFYNEKKLPRIKIFVDSPLAVNATEIFRLHPECYNHELLEIMETDPDPFGFNSLSYIRKVQHSKNLNHMKEPAVIISASGMMDAGRIKHHLANNISDPKNTVLAVGYCAPPTLGARILRGDKEVKIHGAMHEVKADVKSIESFSGHGDYKEMLDYLECQDKKKLKKVFVVHGNKNAVKVYKDHMENRGYADITIPEWREEFEV